MLKKTITYIDYNDNERTEDFYFNLTEAEAAEMEMSINGGLTAMIRRIIAAQDNATIVKVFKELILKAYGVKSLDGRRFEKSDELSKEFEQTPAYTKLFMELSSDSKKAADFFNGILPKAKAGNQAK